MTSFIPSRNDDLATLADAAQQGLLALARHNPDHPLVLAALAKGVFTLPTSGSPGQKQMNAKVAKDQPQMG